MLDLRKSSQPYDIPLPNGLSVTVRPLTTAGMAVAQAARRAVEVIERQTGESTHAGLPPGGLPDLSTEGERDGLLSASPPGGRNAPRLESPPDRRGA